MAMPNDRVPAVEGRRRVAWLLVGVQALLLAGIVLLPPGPGWQKTPLTDSAGSISTAIAFGLGVWAVAYLRRGLTPSPIPNGESPLVVRGPYRWVRHPMYTAVMLFAGGAAIRSGGWLIASLAVALGVFLVFKARWEEERLGETFPGYQAYRARTPRFVPFVGSNNYR